MCEMCIYPKLLPAGVLDDVKLNYVVCEACIDLLVSSCDKYVMSYTT
jgi:hypothetical protein